MYQAKIKIFNRLYKAEGKTIIEALGNLKPNGLAKGMSVLTISKDGETTERILPSVKTARLFSPSHLVREVAIKNTSLLFNWKTQVSISGLRRRPTRSRLKK